MVLTSSFYQVYQISAFHNSTLEHKDLRYSVCLVLPKLLTDRWHWQILLGYISPALEDIACVQLDYNTSNLRTSMLSAKFLFQKFPYILEIVSNLNSICNDL
jgi:hypothetical protein